MVTLYAPGNAFAQMYGVGKDIGLSPTTNALAVNQVKLQDNALAAFPLQQQQRQANIDATNAEAGFLSALRPLQLQGAKQDLAAGRQRMTANDLAMAQQAAQGLIVIQDPAQRNAAYQNWRRMAGNPQWAPEQMPDMATLTQIASMDQAAFQQILGMPYNASTQTYGYSQQGGGQAASWQAPGIMQQATPELLAAMEQQESGGNAAALSPKGAAGLMQIMPATFWEVAPDLGIDTTGWTKAETQEYLQKNPEINRQAGALYYNKMLRQYDGDPVIALAAYNAGPGRVDRWLDEIGDPRMGEIDSATWAQRLPYKETRDYVGAIAGRVWGGGAPGQPGAQPAGAPRPPSTQVAQNGAANVLGQPLTAGDGLTTKSENERYWRIINNVDPSSPDYASAYYELFQRPQMVQTPEGIVPVYTAPPQGVQPPGNPIMDAGIQGVQQAPAAPTAAGPDVQEAAAPAPGQPYAGGVVEGTAKGVSGEAAGRVAAAEEAVTSIQSIEKAIFDEDGDLRYSVLAGARAPIFGGPMPFAEEGRRVYTDMYQAVDAWLRATTGAAAPEQEIQRYLDAYMPGPFDTATSAKHKLTKLRALVTGVSKAVKPNAPSAAPSPAPAQSAPPQDPGAAPDGTVVQMPDGSQQIKRNGQWVPVQ